jgi:hypothetical protein
MFFILYFYFHGTNSLKLYYIIPSFEVLVFEELI